MRTTIDITDELFQKAKTRSAEEGVPLREVVESALRRYLMGGRNRQGYRLHWRTEHGRIQPGVRLDDRTALFDLTVGLP